MNQREITMKYGCLVVLICLDSVGIKEFRFGLALGIGTLKINASSGVFVRVIFALKRSISENRSQTNIILVFLAFTKYLSSQIFDLDIENTLGGGTLAKFRSTMYLTLTYGNSMVSPNWKQRFGMCHEKAKCMHSFYGKPVNRKWR